MKSEKDKKNPIRWTGKLIKEEGTKLFGDKISYHLLDLTKHITYGLLFQLQCIICQFIWPTNTETFIHKKKGCPWCENQCKNLHNCNLEMVIFIGTRIHDGKYIYLNNDPEKVKNKGDIINGWCGIKDHPIFSDMISVHLSVHKKPKPRGCLVCLEEENDMKYEERNFKRRWKNNLELVKIEGKKIHGDSYNYDKTDSESLENCRSILTIECLQIRNGKICGNVFNQRIDVHINNKGGCSICSGRQPYNRTIFVTMCEEKYPGKFLYHRIKEEDIKNSDSKPEVECVFCGFVHTKTCAWEFKSKEIRCLRCTGVELWSCERLKLLCIEKEKDGEYTYENVVFEGKIEKNTIIPITCVKCKTGGFPPIFNQTVSSHFIIGHGCLRCNGNLPWTFSRFQTDIPEILREQFNYNKVKPEMFDGKTAKTCIIPIDCKICGNEFKRSIHQHVVQMRGCNFCPKSEGEQTVYIILKSLNISFFDEVPIREGEKCRFDFKFLYRDKWVIIEYDGQQHFKFVPLWNKTIEKFQERKVKDIYKQYVALKDDCKIIRIDYSINKNDFRTHILKALESEERVYYSTPEMYDWLEIGVRNYSPS